MKTSSMSSPTAHPVVYAGVQYVCACTVKAAKARKKESKSFFTLFNFVEVTK